MTEVTEAKRTKILRQVRALLDKADSTEFPEEAAAYRAKAETFMREYRIEEEQALAVDPASLAPEMRIVDLAPSGNAFSSSYLNLFHAITAHTGIRARYIHSGGKLIAQAVGYGFDLGVTELLFTSARLAFSEHLEPTVDPLRTEEENVYRLRRSGLERWRVAQLVWGSDPKNGAAHGKVAKIYAAECEKLGEPVALAGRGTSAEVYRESYAVAFVARFDRRLRTARQGADRTGGAVQLAGREDRVNEAFYERFPEYRPAPVTESAAAAPASCPDCEKSKHTTKRCRPHRPAKWTKADEARYVRTHESASARAGLGAGSAAADTVTIDGSEPTKRLDDRTGGEREVTRAVRGVLGE